MNERQCKKNQLAYQEYGYLLNEMIDLLKDNKYDAVHGLPRGGLPIAVHMSHYLKIPMIYSISQFKSEFPNGKLLVVDDIVDTGTSFNRLIEITDFKDVDFDSATLYYKPHSEYIPNYYIKETLDWIIFPWEPFNEPVNREMYEHLNKI